MRTLEKIKDAFLMAFLVLVIVISIIYMLFELVFFLQSIADMYYLQQTIDWKAGSIFLLIFMCLLTSFFYDKEK